jgi:transposase-like protein
MKTIQLHSESMQSQTAPSLSGTEGARRATGVPDNDGNTFQPVTFSPPDPEVAEKKPRRRFTAAYKLRILREYEACKQPGEIGVLLRREALYHSNISTWQRQRDQGSLHGLSPRKRGRKPKEVNPMAQKVARLERENRRLANKLKQAETIIEVQKKISEVLGIPQSNNGDVE